MFKKLFSTKQPRNDQELERRQDFEHLERAQNVSTRLAELREADAEWFNVAAGMIFLAQQDFYRHYGIDFSGNAVVKRYDIEKNLRQAMEVLGRLCVDLNKTWVDSARRKETEKTFIYGAAFNAADFWFTDMAARGANLTALKLCVEKNHLLICTAEREDVLRHAERFRGIFLDLPAYEFAGSHWPYRDADASIAAWSEARAKLFPKDT